MAGSGPGRAPLRGGGLERWLLLLAGLRRRRFQEEWWSTLSTKCGITYFSDSGCQAVATAAAAASAAVSSAYYAAAASSCSCFDSCCKMRQEEVLTIY